MSDIEFQRFREIVLADESLQQQLCALHEKEAFVRHVVELGLRYGCEFSPDEVEDAMRAGRRSWFEYGI